MYNTDRAFRLKLCVHIGEYFSLLRGHGCPSGGSEELKISNCSAGEDSWESLGLQGDQTSQSILNIHWNDWCLSWSSNTLATWFSTEPTHWKRPWCWKTLKAKREEGRRGWDSYIASPAQWIRIGETLGDSKGQGCLACCSPWGLSQTQLSDWTKTTCLAL